MENKDLDVIWPVGMRGTEDRPFTFPPGTTDEQRAEDLPRGDRRAGQDGHRSCSPRTRPRCSTSPCTPRCCRRTSAIPRRSICPTMSSSSGPTTTTATCAACPPGSGKWKHGVYYHLAYLGGQLTQAADPHRRLLRRLPSEFDKIVKAGRHRVHAGQRVGGARLRHGRPHARGHHLGRSRDLCHARPRRALHRMVVARVLRRKGRSRGGMRTTSTSRCSIRRTHFGRLPMRSRNCSTGSISKVAGETYAGDGRRHDDPMQSRNRQLEEALAAESRAEDGMSLSRAAVLLHGRRARPAGGPAADAGGTQVGRGACARRMLHGCGSSFGRLARHWNSWKRNLARAEYPPFDRWYQESWIRTTLSQSNPHRPYIQLRAFISSDGRRRVIPLTRGAGFIPRGD